MSLALGILETTGLTPALVALDAMDKAAGVQVLQAEINDLLGICLKVTGTPSQVKIALEAGLAVAERMNGKPVADVIRRPDEEAWRVIKSPPEFNPLIQQDVVHFPSYEVLAKSASREETVAETTSYALGFIETQGFTAVFEAIDTACKAANVQVIGKEKLGGGYVTVVIKGDVAAVKAAIEAGRQKVPELGKLIAAHVIPRPSESVLALLPRA
jgi:microcompartment protein CcmL/EutN